jgi:hypothetical protein
MFLREILRVLFGGLVATGTVSVKRRAQDAAFAAVCYAVAAWCLVTAALVFAVAAWLALAPEIGPASAAAVVGVAFLILGIVPILIQLSRRRTERMAKKLAEATNEQSELQRQVVQAVTSNIGPLVIAAIGTFIASRLSRRD